MAMWSGDRPFYRGGREVKTEREGGGGERETHRERETNTHADGHIDRWTDRHSKLGRGHALHRKTVKEVVEKVTEALL